MTTKRWTETRARAEGRAAQCLYPDVGVTVLSIDAMTTVATATTARSIQDGTALSSHALCAALTVRVGEA